MAPIHLSVAPFPRRRLLRLAAVAALGPAALAAGGRSREPDGEAAPSKEKGATSDALPFSISLAQWSLHRAHFGGTLDPMDFPLAARRDYGLEAVEYVNTFYKARIGEAALAGELRRRCDDAGVRSLLIMCDGLGALGDPDEGQRRRAVENHRPWLELAKALGCHSIRVNAQSSGSPEEQRSRAADGLRRLCERADPLELFVIVENHGGLSSNGAWLASTIEATGHPRCGTLPDFGNFNLGNGETYDRYRGVAELMPFARGVSAKSHDFDAQGDETGTDYARMLRIVLDAGYRGFIGIEYEGSRLPEPDGIRATKALLMREGQAWRGARR